MRVLDLFSGIGGFSLGLERTGGFRTVAFCEIDPFCRDVLAKHWPDVPCHNDIETRQFEEGEADVITAGFPCQDISHAGLGAGLAGARSGLYRHVVRAIRLVRPRFAILENVAALLGRGMGTVLGDLAEVGVDAEWHCIPASAVGAPHIRDRVWIIAKPQYPDPDEPGPHRAAMHERGIPAEFRDEQVCLSGPLGEALADADQPRLAKRETDAGRPSEARRRQPRHPSVGSGNWRTEPDVDRVAHGVPARVDRLRSLGNAVVPQIPELIGRAILSAREP